MLTNILPVLRSPLDLHDLSWKCINYFYKLLYIIINICFIIDIYFSFHHIWSCQFCI